MGYMRTAAAGPSMRGLASRARRTFRAALLGAAGVLPLIGGAALARETVKVGLIVPWAPYGFWYVAKEKHLAPDLDLQISIINDPLQSQAMLAAGTLDVVDSTLEYVPLAVEQKLPIKVVVFQTLSQGADQVIMAPGVNGPDGLKGRKVATQEGFLGQIMVGMYLEKIGLKPSDMTWVNLGPDQAISPMMTGDVKLAYLFEPWSSQALHDMKGSQEVFSTRDPIMRRAAVGGDAIYMSSQFLSTRRDTARKALKAYWDGVGYWRKNTAASNALIAAALHFSLPDVTGTIGKDGSGKDGPSQVNTFHYAAQFCGVAGGPMPDGQQVGQIYRSLETINDWWIKLGQMKTHVAVKDGVDCGLMKDLATSESLASQ